MSELPTFGAWLWQQRRQLDLTQAALAQPAAWRAEGQALAFGRAIEMGLRLKG